MNLVNDQAVAKPGQAVLNRQELSALLGGVLGNSDRISDREYNLVPLEKNKNSYIAFDLSDGEK